MTLVMFDIDGTLTESFALDSSAFLDALRDVFGFDDVCDDWAKYQHVTDAGILAEVFALRQNRQPRQEEISRIQAHFVALLAARADSAGGIRPVCGVTALLMRLFVSPDGAVAYASGSWGDAARFKLHSAGLPFEGVPSAFSDDEVSREGLCRLARTRAEIQYGKTFRRVIYVGDGVWDMRTSQSLGYGFIGIGCGAGAEKLRAEGAFQVLSDFRDSDRFVALISNTETQFYRDRTKRTNGARGR
jgi:phosphoglycolate phosphatase-like HAD superfamily hydrolase